MPLLVPLPLRVPLLFPLPLFPLPLLLLLVLLVLLALSPKFQVSRPQRPKNERL
jgi:hypothetical protein